MRDDYSFRPHLARNGEGAAPVRVSRKPLFGPAALTASRGGDGEGGGGKGRGLWVGACIDGCGRWLVIGAVEKAVVDRAADWQ